MNNTAINNQLENDSPGVNFMPPAVFYSCLVLGGVLEFLFPIDFVGFPMITRIILGLLVGAAGFAFMAAGHELFKKRGTNVPTNLPATALVVQGAYRFSRNPMYVGGLGFLLGIGILAGSWWIMAACLPLWLYLAFYVIPSEEAYMEREFGEEYAAYTGKVRRWL